MSMRDQILAAAVMAARDHGLAGVRRKAIADACGVTEGLVSYHLGQVDDYTLLIAREAVERRILPIVAEVLTMPADRRPAVEIPQDVIAAAAAWIERGGRYAME